MSFNCKFPLRGSRLNINRSLLAFIERCSSPNLPNVKKFSDDVIYSDANRSCLRSNAACMTITAKMSNFLELCTCLQGLFSSALFDNFFSV